jgi:hypothetical protein
MIVTIPDSIASNGVMPNVSYIEVQTNIPFGGAQLRLGDSVSEARFNVSTARDDEIVSSLL